MDGGLAYVSLQEMLSIDVTITDSVIVTRDGGLGILFEIYRRNTAGSMGSWRHLSSMLSPINGDGSGLVRKTGVG